MWKASRPQSAATSRSIGSASSYGVTIGNEPRALMKVLDSPRAHAYAAPTSTLTKGYSMGKYKRDCQYGHVGNGPQGPYRSKSHSSLTGTGMPGTIFKYEGHPPCGIASKIDGPCGVHAYAAPRSSLRPNGQPLWGRSRPQSAAPGLRARAAPARDLPMLPKAAPTRRANLGAEKLAGGTIVKYIAASTEAALFVGAGSRMPQRPLPAVWDL